MYIVTFFKNSKKYLEKRKKYVSLHPLNSKRGLIR